MKKMTVALSAMMLLGASSQAMAQINDVTLTVSPILGYTFWDKSLNLGESPSWGVRAGFGFGRNLELRAIYEKSFDLKGKLQGSGWSLLNTLGNKLEGSDVNIERIGGELKVNLWHGTTFVPYLTAGAGVLNFSYDKAAGQSYKEEQLYGALGAGVKINFSKRTVLSLEAKNTLFNVNKNNLYLVAGANPDDVLQNWGGQASLDFYLGGSSNASAYRAVSGDGFKGIKFAVEPGIAYLSFGKNSVLNDQWLVGGSAGIDFSSIIGIRGFYYAATEKPQTLNLNFTSDLKMYGANLIARLSQPRGITPYLTLGAGYLDIDEKSYVDKNGLHMAQSGWFAMGGAGLEFPINRYVALYGNVNALLNSEDNLSDVNNPSQVNVNLMYQAGVRFNIGSRGRLSSSVYAPYVEQARLDERAANMRELNELRAKYDAQINSLNNELAQAVEERDAAKVAAIVEERKQVVAEKQQVVEVKQATTSTTSDNSVLMTRPQLEELVARVTQSKPQVQQAQPVQLGDATLSDLDKVLLYSVLSNYGYRVPATTTAPTFVAPASPALVAPTQAVDTTQQALNKVLDRTEDLLRKVEVLEKKVNNDTPTSKITLIDVDGEGVKSHATTESKSCCKSKTSVAKHNDADATFHVSEEPKSFLTYTGSKVLAGLGFGDATTFNLAVRPTFQMGTSDFSFAPEFFYGFGSESAWGLTANAVYNFNLGAASFKPYAGIGLGYTRVAGTGRFGTNVILGTSFENVLGGRLFVDYSLRPQFKNHQIAVGYSLSF